MHSNVLLGFSALLLAGCAGGSGPFYDFRPADPPLRYEIGEHGNLMVETPVGEQTARDSTKATIMLEVHGGSPEARDVSISFEALEMWTGGDFPKQHVGGGELLGQSFKGVLSRDGSIEVSVPPEIPAEVTAVGDPTALFANMLSPLPPEGDASMTSWPHKTTSTSRAAVSLESSYDGTASFAGDTIWNGVPARIIVSEGINTVSGEGRPAGATGEIAFNFTGRAVARYVWDPQRGVMLAATMRTEGGGELEVKEMAMSMPIKFEGVSTVRITNHISARPR